MKVLLTVLALAAGAAGAATVSPSGAVAPANLLRIEVLLDAPLEPSLDMESGHPARRCRRTHR